MVVRAGIVLGIVISVLCCAAIAEPEAGGDAAQAPVVAGDNWVPLINYPALFAKMQEVQDLTVQAAKDRQVLQAEDLRRAKIVRDLTLARDKAEKGSPE